MKVAIVHDDLVQWGGAERVLEGICEIFPDAPIYTSVFDKNNHILKNKFGSKKIITSFLQSIPGWEKLYKPLLPLYPIAFEQFNFDGFDLVISHTTRFAKSILTRPNTKHICYCHTPPRFLWHFSQRQNFAIAELLMTKLRLYDQISAQRVDYFLAGSENARRRIKKIYRRDSLALYPFVDLNRFLKVESFQGGYFVIIARPNKYLLYKRANLTIEACKKAGVELKVISGDLEEETVVKILAGCKALIISGVEDFGLSSLEAQALGKPVIAYKEGGSLETVIEGKTGFFFKSQTVDDLAKTLGGFDSQKIDPNNCIDNAKRFSKENFVKNFKQALASLG